MSLPLLCFFFFTFFFLHFSSVIDLWSLSFLFFILLILQETFKCGAYGYELPNKGAGSPSTTKREATVPFEQGRVRVLSQGSTTMSRVTSNVNLKRKHGALLMIFRCQLLVPSATWSQICLQCVQSSSFAILVERNILFLGSLSCFWG